MIHDMKPYPAYKDSGVSWLGQVPEHWEVKRNKLFMKEINDRSDDGSEELLTVSQYTGVTRRREKLSEEGELLTNAASLVGYKHVMPNDLVMNIMLAWNGSLGVSPIEGIVSPAYCVYRSGPIIEPRFLHYLFRTPLYTGVFKTESTGVVDSRLRLYPEVFFRLQSLIPPLPEQSAIVRYLDYMDHRIRRYIHAKQKLIKLLEEQKQAIIHRAVTRGLDPNVKLKPSGVEWLGDVPEHWEIKRFKFLTRINSGQVDPRDEIYANYTLIAPNHIKSGIGKITHFETAKEQGADSGKYLVEKGQIIYSKIRPNLRKAAIAPRNCLCSADMYAISVREDEINPDFLLNLMLSEPFTKFAVDCSLRVAMPKINRESLNECWLWYPSLDEQYQIIKYLTSELVYFNDIIDHAEQEISLLREYRTRLIADVVTGKLDVREAAASLPDEVEEPEVLEDEENTEVDPEGEPEENIGED